MMPKLPNVRTPFEISGISSLEDSDSDRLTSSNETSVSPEFTGQPANKVIEEELNSFVNSFRNTRYTESIPILVIPQQLGIFINKCFRYYAAISNLAPFYIKINDVTVLAICRNDHLKQRYFDKYEKTFLSLTEDCEQVCIKKLFNVIVRNNHHNKLKRNLVHEFKDYELPDPDIYLKPLAFPVSEDSATSKMADTLKDTIKEDLVLKSTLNVNAKEFIPQNRPVPEGQYKDEKLPVIYSFSPVIPPNAGDNVHQSYVFTPDQNVKAATCDSSPKTENKPTSELSENQFEFPDNSLNFHVMESLKTPPLTPKSAVLSIIKDLPEQDSSTSSSLSLATSKYFTSTPMPTSQELVPPLNFSGSTVSFEGCHPPMKLASTFVDIDLHHLDSSRSLTDSSKERMGSYESCVKGLMSLILPDENQQIYSNRSAESALSTIPSVSTSKDDFITASTDIFYTAEGFSSSIECTSIVNSPITLSPTSENVPAMISKVEPASSSTDFEVSFPEELSSSESVISEPVANEFMGGAKYSMDHIIEYKGFLEQASKFIIGSPLLVQSLRTVNDFEHILQRQECIIELYNIPESFSILDILRLYNEEPRNVIWCDDTHALLLTRSACQAQRALKLENEYIKSRPLVDASPISTIVACSFDLVPWFKKLDKWVEKLDDH